MYLVISTSLNPNSRSRILASAAMNALASSSATVDLIDLSDTELPPCDGATCYSHANSVKVTEAITSAKGILIAGPIYNYDLGSSAKNMMEITGKAWTDKVVGFLCAAGGQGSYMAPMQMANSLMLDFRSIVIPRFVYATGEAFSGNDIAETDVDQRIAELTQQLMTITSALYPQQPE